MTGQWFRTYSCQQGTKKGAVLTCTAPFLHDIGLQIVYDSQNLLFCLVCLLLVNLGGHDAAVLSIPIIADVVIFSCCAAIDARRIGRHQQSHLLDFRRLVYAVHTLDGSLNLGADGEVVDGCSV